MIFIHWILENHCFISTMENHGSFLITIVTEMNAFAIQDICNCWVWLIPQSIPIAIFEFDCSPKYAILQCLSLIAPQKYDTLWLSNLINSPMYAIFQWLSLFNPQRYALLQLLSLFNPSRYAILLLLSF